MKKTVDGFILDSGREIDYVNCHIIGLAADDDIITAGFDNEIFPTDRDGEPAPFTPAERQEIACYMISLWAKWGGVSRGYFGNPPKFDVVVLDSPM